MSVYTFVATTCKENTSQPHTITLEGKLIDIVKENCDLFQKNTLYQIEGTEYQLRRTNNNSKKICWYPNSLAWDLQELDFDTVISDLLLGSKLGFLKNNFNRNFLNSIINHKSCSECSREIKRVVRRGFKLRWAGEGLEFFSFQDDKLICQLCIKKQANIKKTELVTENSNQEVTKVEKVRSLYFGEFSNEDIVPFINENADTGLVLFVDGKEFKVKINSIRLQTLKKSQQCKCCGLEGTVWKITRHLQDGTNEFQGPHLNLFTKEGRMTTSDHIIPKSKGGPDKLDNTQTLCINCNVAKRDKIITLEDLKKSREGKLHWTYTS